MLAHIAGIPVEESVIALAAGAGVAVATVRGMLAMLAARTRRDR